MTPRTATPPGERRSAVSGVAVSPRLVPRLVVEPALVLPFLAGLSSIATLLLYFGGVVPMGQAVAVLLVPSALALGGFAAWAAWTGRSAIARLVGAGLSAGAIATLAYDVVRVPVAWGGVPVFKAISYFGTIILGQPSPSIASEVVGWAYHLSNGIGFGLMYATLVRVPHWWTGAAWGLLLEGAMLATPYAEVFGYRMSEGFLALTISAHMVYGVVLSVALSRSAGWVHGGDHSSRRRLRARLGIGGAVITVGLVAVAWDFHMRHASALPPSPPPYLGRHLYTTWNILEPDRLAALWVHRRFVDPRARYHFVTPFTSVGHGTPFDVPEAAVRRTARSSATEVLLASLPRSDGDDRLALLGRMTHLYEISPWRMQVDREAYALGQELIASVAECRREDVASCAERAFTMLDAWYASGAPVRRTPRRSYTRRRRTAQSTKKTDEEHPPARSTRILNKKS